MRPKYIFCFICLIASRLITVLFSVYMQLWVISFEKRGILPDKETSDAIYRNIIIGSMGSILIILPFFGYYSDRLDSRVIVPASFLARGAIAASVKFIEDPRSWYAYLAAVLVIILSNINFISVEVLFMRKMNGHVRGTL